MPKAYAKRLTATQKASRVIQPQVSSKSARRTGLTQVTRRVSTKVSSTTVSSQR